MKKIKYLVIFMTINFLFLTDTFAQSPSEFLKKGKEILKGGKDVVKEGNGLVKEVGNLSKTLKKTTKEFNETVKVIKGDDEDKINKMSKNELNQLKIKNDKIQNLDWTPFISLDNQLFPSSILTLNTFQGQTTPELESIIRPIGIIFKSKTSNIPIKWEIECVDKRFFDKISGYCLYDNPSNKPLLRNPEIPWNIESLAKQNSSTPINFIFRIFDDNNNKVEKTLSAYMRSIDDCLRFYNDTSTQFLYTAYVQEEHPEIRKILKEATDTKIVNSINGYGSDVDLQVAAIWRVLHDRGINYSTITTTAGGNNKSNIYSQVVRTFDKSITDNQANCVDGTIVFASILRKIGIHSVLVLVKGHCFLGYYQKPDVKGSRQNIVFLETTVLDGDDLINNAKEKAKNVKDKKKALQIINQGYISQFKSAQDIGSKEYAEYLAKNEVYQIIDVDKEREHLTKPIPFYED